MLRDLVDPQNDGTSDEFDITPGVYFDPEKIALQSQYLDELAAFRAKRCWSEILESTFLLDPDQDFSLKVSSIDGLFVSLSCEFHSACARYAFWRLTNNQAPEAQYLIETAHIPKSSVAELTQAPDMCSTRREPLILSGEISERPVTASFQERVSRVISQLLNFPKK